MVCSNCGTEIADKAIVCFRCGQSTVAPLRKPAPPPSRWRGAASILVFVVLALAALFLGQAGTLDVPDSARYAVIAVALVLLGWRFARRRRR
jgi:hypothetical protein